jgi:hypothetical protein
MRAIPSPDQHLATRDDILRIQRQLAELRDFIDRIMHDQQVQFTRIAQLQADIDVIRGARSQIQSPPPSPVYEGPDRRR